MSTNWENVETEGCGGGQEAQKPLVLMSILKLDQDYGCQGQVGTNVGLQIQETQRLCPQLSLSMFVPCPGETEDVGNMAEESVKKGGSQALLLWDSPDLSPGWGDREDSSTDSNRTA